MRFNMPSLEKPRQCELAGLERRKLTPEPTRDMGCSNRRPGSCNNMPWTIQGREKIGRTRTFAYLLNKPRDAGMHKQIPENHARTY